MRIEWSDDFDRFLTQAEGKAAAGDPEVLDLIGTMLEVLRDLDSEPTVETATLKRVVQARRHRLWRLAHPFLPGVAVRIICWFPGDDIVVLAILGFDKAKHGDVWYASAAARGEGFVDDWIRKGGTR